MRCSKCGSENPDGLKFCGQCAAPVAMICPQCHFENPPGFKFCGQCTAPLSVQTGTTKGKPSLTKATGAVRVVEEEASPTLEGERKTVTALFADIKGSMELIEDLDPEEARALVDPALKLMIDAVHRYDGYIVQSTGDGIFALFGAPVAHEDHPQRALYAAFRMQEELRRYSDRIRSEGRLPIQVRVGVNNGEVVVRSIKTGEGQTEYTPDRSFDQSCVADAGAGADRFDCEHRSGQKALRGLLHFQKSRSDQGQRRQRASRGVRGYGSRTAANAIATLGGTRADEIRRP